VSYQGPQAPNMALQRTRRPRFRSGRSLRSLGSPLNARPLGRGWLTIAGFGLGALISVAGCSSASSSRNKEGIQPYVKPVDAECRSIEPPKLQHRVEPKYPADVRKQGLQGIVIVEGILGTDGMVSDIYVLQSPSKTLSHLASEAVRQWRYTPAYCNDLGKPIRVYLTVTSTFSLHRK
jgi:TonB family protein